MVEAKNPVVNPVTKLGKRIRSFVLVNRKRRVKANKTFLILDIVTAVVALGRRISISDLVNTKYYQREIEELLHSFSFEVDHTMNR